MFTTSAGKKSLRPALEKIMAQSQTCTSTLVQKIDAPLPLVWSVLGRFDNPQAYKQFVKSCTLTAGDGGPGSVREVSMVSGLPAEMSVERLDVLDEKSHVMVFSIVGGDQRLKNYRSTTTLRNGNGNGNQTEVIESYVVDVPWDSNAADTCCVADFVASTNLRNLARLTEKMAAVDFDT